ncbi:hypothetical protein [Winogradskyella bathintestinalis]|nr:hypothetical protein [Winogradskyella bathintestinalis]
MILISKYLVPKGYLGLTVFPFMFLKTSGLKENRILINHEKIHLRQQLELFIFPFYIIYTIEFLIRLIQYKDWHLAYRNISFEREAYKHEKDFFYLKSRPLFNVINFINK